MKTLTQKFSCLLLLCVISGSFLACSRQVRPLPYDANKHPDAEIIIPIDANTTFQTIDGFGFFGGIGGIWLSPNPNDFYNDAWLDMVFNDLGITIWRDELYPHYPDPRINTNPDRKDTQDGWWEKKRPIVQAIYNKARETGTDLKVVLTVWSPPSELKCYHETSGQWHTPTGVVDESRPNTGLTKQGGALKPSAYEEYAHWLVDGIRMYEEAGIPVYAISPQNEPNFYEPYNSCQYTEALYVNMLKTIAPIIKAEYPDIKIFGSEHIAHHDVNWTRYHQTIENSPDALRSLDIWAYHGYYDGVNASDESSSSDMWSKVYEQYRDTNKPMWMTETSDGGQKFFSEDIDGALHLAHAIHLALYHGHISAWIWWQGSNQLKAGIDGYTLTADTLTGYKYAASKHFYRFIRPGAKMIGSQSPDSDILVSAFRNAEDNSTSIIIINFSEQSCELGLNYSTLPKGPHTLYRTSDTEFCKKIETIDITKRIVIKAKSINTLTCNY